MCVDIGLLPLEKVNLDNVYLAHSAIFKIYFIIIILCKLLLFEESAIHEKRGIDKKLYLPTAPIVV